MNKRKPVAARYQLLREIDYTIGVGDRVRLSTGSLPFLVVDVIDYDRVVVAYREGAHVYEWWLPRACVVLYDLPY